ncbi:hypothetical protein GSY69_09210 [Brevibacterium sp. 5221]|uniref:Uncharacterized protein n=1 Tax=Brevibacterium rongguiense TaxID=2695267 RepID=A0A6N9H7Z8_9MICO|nr:MULTISPECIES: hypothetical protein [Brevibacterium]MYM20140.1 hypothetical protein [Brevibacterium rongguiense]WAL39448.1 hypothetical protein BRM1_09170 [Brevibacterium sp. BRM-1]
MDTQSLEAAAQRWAALADRMARLAADCRAAQGVEWHSPAAEDFRCRLGEQAGRIAAAGSVGGDVVGAYRAHIAAVAAVPDMEVGRLVRTGPWPAGAGAGMAP